MDYLLTFLEGVITFISPCLLPMLPVYIMYFSGGNEADDDKKSKTARNAAFFIAGFTTLFVALGALAGAVGSFLIKQKNTVAIVSGVLLIIFGLNYTGLLKIALFNKSKRSERQIKITGAFSAYLFGLIFAAGWTPCIGTFLSSALMKASAQATAAQGVLMLLIYSAGLGVPFFFSAVLLDKLKTAFDFIKAHYKIINTLAGVFLIAYGLYLMIPAVTLLLK